jgi:hypothetical protein
MLFEPTIAGSLPKPGWLAETEKLWPKWKLEGEALDEAKRDAALLWIKEQEDAGIETVCDGEQFRTHFVHGFLETVEGIDWDLKTPMGIRNNRYVVDVPTWLQGQSAAARCIATRPPTAAPIRGRAEIHAPRPDDDLRHTGRRPFRTTRRHGDGIRRNPQRGSPGTGGGRRRRRSNSTSRPSTSSWTTSMNGASPRLSGLRAT